MSCQPFCPPADARQLPCSWPAAAVSTDPARRVCDCSEVTPDATRRRVLTRSSTPAQTACVRLPAAGSGGAEYLYAALATDGEPSRTRGHRRLPDQAQAGAGAAAAASRPPGARPLRRAPTAARGLPCDRSAARERALSEQPPAVAQFDRRPSPAAAVATPPVVWATSGPSRCAHTPSARPSSRAPRPPRWSASAWPSIWMTRRRRTATPRPISTRSGQLFDRPSLSDRHHRLRPRVGPRQQRRRHRPADPARQRAHAQLQLAPAASILGYFFGLDLLPSQAHSNDGEVFYGLVPDPTTRRATISKNFATGFLPPAFIHEFQHMISFNQHVLVRQRHRSRTPGSTRACPTSPKSSAAGVPDSSCHADFTNCETQFLRRDIDNAYAYLDDPETNFLVEPGSRPGRWPSAGRTGCSCAGWPITSAATQPVATELTRALVQTNRTRRGQRRGRHRASISRRSCAQWQLANYLDDLPGLHARERRLRYTSSISEHVPATSTWASSPSRTRSRRTSPVTRTVTTGPGTLRAGSGRHLDIVQPASAGEVDASPHRCGRYERARRSVKPRVALVRIR